MADTVTWDGMAWRAGSGAASCEMSLVGAANSEATIVQREKAASKNRCRVSTSVK